MTRIYSQVQRTTKLKYLSKFNKYFFNFTCTESPLNIGRASLSTLSNRCLSVTAVEGTWKQVLPKNVLLRFDQIDYNFRNTRLEKPLLAKRIPGNLCARYLVLLKNAVGDLIRWVTGGAALCRLFQEKYTLRIWEIHFGQAGTWCCPRMLLEMLIRWIRGGGALCRRVEERRRVGSSRAWSQIRWAGRSAMVQWRKVDVGEIHFENLRNIPQIIWEIWSQNMRNALYRIGVIQNWSKIRRASWWSNGAVEWRKVKFDSGLFVGAENAKQDSWIGRKMRRQARRYWIRFMCEGRK